MQLLLYCTEHCKHVNEIYRNIQRMFATDIHSRRRTNVFASARIDAYTMLAIVVLCQSDTLENFDQQCNAADNTENCRHGESHERASRRRGERKGFLSCFVADRMPNIGIERSARCSVPTTVTRRYGASACGVDIGGVIE